MILFTRSEWFGLVLGGAVVGSLRRCCICCFETILEIFWWSQGGYVVMIVGMGAELTRWVEVGGKYACSDLGGNFFSTDLAGCAGMGGTLVGVRRPG